MSIIPSGSQVSVYPQTYHVNSQSTQQTGKLLKPYTYRKCPVKIQWFLQLTKGFVSANINSRLVYLKRGLISRILRGVVRAGIPHSARVHVVLFQPKFSLSNSLSFLVSRPLFAKSQLCIIFQDKDS